MKDDRKTKKALIEELKVLRKQVTDPELPARPGEESAFFKYSPVPVLICEGRYREILDANPAAVDIYGYTKEKLLTMSFRDLRYTASDKRSGRFTKHGGIEQHRTGNGSVLLVDAAAHKIRYRGKRAEAIFITDVTEIEGFKKDFESTWKHLSYVRDLAGIAYFVMKVSGPGKYTYSYVNRIAETMLLAKQEEIIGKSPTALIPFIGRKTVQDTVELYDRCVLEKRMLEIEQYFPCGEGGELWLIQLQPVLDDESSASHLLGTGINLTRMIDTELNLGSRERNYRTLVDTMNDGLASIDLNGMITFVNKALCQDLCYTKEELVGKNAIEFMDEENFAILRQSISQRTEGQVEPYELTLNAKNGSRIDYLITPSLIYGEEGTLIGSFGVLKDITAKKKAEEELRRKSEMLRRIAEGITDVIFETDMELNYTYVTPSVERLIGYTSEEFILHPVPETLTRESSERMRRIFSEMMESEKNGELLPKDYTTCELEFRLKGGGTTWGEMRVSFSRGENGKATGFRGAIRDISERKVAETALLERESQLRSVADNSPNQIILWDKDLKIRFANRSLAGRTVDEMVGLHLRNTVPAGEWKKVKDVFNRVRESRTGTSYEVEGISTDDRYTSLEMHIGPVLDAEGDLSGYVTNTVDVTERRKSEQRLADSEERWRSVIESSPNYILVMEPDGVVVSLNRTITGAGVETIIGTNLLDHISGDFRERTEASMKKVLEDGETVHFTNQTRKPDGDPIFLSVSITPIMANGRIPNLLFTATDVTERRMAELNLERQTKLSGLFMDSIPCFALLVDKEREISAANKIAEEMGGRPGRKCYQTLFGFEEACEWCLMDEMFETDEPQHAVKENQGIIWDAHWIPIDEDSYLHYAFDITARVRSEEKVRESEDRLSAFMEAATDGFLLFDSELQVIKANKAALDLFPKREIRDLYLDQILEAFDTDVEAAGRLEAYREVIRTGISVHFEDVASGDVNGGKHLDLSAFKVGDGMGLIVSDNTEKRRMLQAVSESEERFRTLAENTPDVIIRVDTDYRCLYASPIAEKYMKFPADKIEGKTLRELGLNPATCETLETIVDDVFTTGDHRKEINALNFPTGKVYMHQEAVPEFDQNGSVASVLISHRDVTPIMEAEAALARSERRYRELVEGTDDLITIMNGDGILRFVNHISEDIFGLRSEECLGRSVFDFIHPDDREVTRKWFYRNINQGALTSTIENRLINTATVESFNTLWRGNFHYDEKGNIIEVIGIAHDITEQKKLERQILHIEKLDSLGVLAGGIAHDFNNLLMGIMGNTGLARMKLPDESPAQKELERVQSTAQVAADLTNQMLAFSGKGSFEIKPVDLSGVISQMDQLLKTVISTKADVKYELAVDLPAVNADVSQLQQVVLNLLTNASDALGQEGDSIKVSTGAVELSEDDIAAMYFQEGLVRGEHVFFEVIDTGCGMSEEVKERLFEPFFSTKHDGRGLGLAAVMGVVKAHRGGMYLESKPGKGTTFRVYFPISEKTVHESTSESAADDSWEGTGTILVVDDEEMVRSVTKNMLEEKGFTVLTASDGSEGVEVFGEHPQGIDLVVLDLTMPVMDGEEAFDEIRKMSDKVPIIMMSGYSNKSPVSRLLRRDDTTFLQKPFTHEELFEKIRGLFGQERETAR